MFLKRLDFVLPMLPRGGKKKPAEIHINVSEVSVLIDWKKLFAFTFL